jgi:hypothetical protein
MKDVARAVSRATDADNRQRSHFRQREKPALTVDDEDTLALSAFFPVGGRSRDVSAIPDMRRSGIKGREHAASFLEGLNGGAIVLAPRVVLLAAAPAARFRCSFERVLDSFTTSPA